MSQSTLSELETDTYPTSTFTTRLAHIYSVSARWLADGEGPMVVDSAPPTAPSQPTTRTSLWPFSSRISPEAYDALDASTKEDIEDYVELKLSKAAGAPRKSAARKTREVA